MFASSTRGPARRGVSERVAVFKQQESFTAEDSDVFLKTAPTLPIKASPRQRRRLLHSARGRSRSDERCRATSAEATSGRVTQDSVDPKPPAGNKKSVSGSGGVAADVAGAVGNLYNISRHTDFPASHVRRRTTDAPVHRTRTADDPPALPPRMPIFKKNLSTQSSTKLRSHSSERYHSRSSEHTSTDSFLSADAATMDKGSPTPSDDALDVFIPLPRDAQKPRDGTDRAGGCQEETGRQTQHTLNSSESEQTASLNISAERREYEDNDACVGLDVLVGTEDGGLDVVVGTEDEEQPTLDGFESNRTSFVHDSDDDHNCVSEHHSQFSGPGSKRTRANIGRRLTRKETHKLSRKLTRKMSCRQQHALMMAAEFDEFDELDVVVESGSVTDDEDDDDGGGGGGVGGDGVKLSVSDEKTDGNPEDVPDGDISDVGFDQRVTTRLHYDRLQVELDSRQIMEELKEVKMSTVQRIANELLCTERTYVKKLYLIDQIFHWEIIRQNRTFHYFPEDVVPQMFCNVKSIYQFHNDFLLPQLEQRMTSWNTTPYIGDVMKKFAPFLKLYADYVKNFDRAMELINTWTEKSQEFASLLQALQNIPECGHLTLQHHMLEPIQRVPRYELLLRDYLKHLGTDSPDHENTENALVLVAKAAVHSNEAMRKMEKFRKLLDINESLGDMIDLISPTRELIKEGKILRIAARDGDRYERYMLLFNDLLLICTSIAVVIGTKQRYRIKSKIDVDGMEVCDGNNLVIANTFIVKGRQKSIELLASSIEETNEWLKAFEQTITDFIDKLRSRKATQPLDIMTVEELGNRAPTWVKDQETSMCMRCTNTFTMFRWRHHCRACGLVVCRWCSTRKIALPYDEGRENKVCDDCYLILQRSDSPPTGELCQRRKLPCALQVKANDPSVITGYLSMSLDKKTWHRRWFSVHSDFVLYSFKAHQDVVAMTSLPLPGYQVSAASDGTSDVRFVVSHVGSQTTYYFDAESQTTRDRWVDVLKSVVMMVLPKQPAAPSRNLSSSVQPTSADHSSSDTVIE